MDLQECPTRSTHLDLQGHPSRSSLSPTTWEYYKGTIVQHDAREKLFKILYEDGDGEELSHDEVIKYATAPPTTSTTRFQHNEQEYWAAQQSNRRKNSKTINALQYSRIAESSGQIRRSEAVGRSGSTVAT